MFIEELPGLQLRAIQPAIFKVSLAVRLLRTEKPQSVS